MSMDITCDWCGRAATVESTAAALDAGWYTHTVGVGYVTFGGGKDEPVSMGFVCGVCTGTSRFAISVNETDLPDGFGLYAPIPEWSLPAGSETLTPFDLAGSMPPAELWITERDENGEYRPVSQIPPPARVTAHDRLLGSTFEISL